MKHKAMCLKAASEVLSVALRYRYPFGLQRAVLTHQSCCFLCSASSCSRRSIFSCFLSSLRERDDTFLANSRCFSSFSLCGAARDSREGAGVQQGAGQRRGKKQTDTDHSQSRHIKQSYPVSYQGNTTASRLPGQPTGSAENLHTKPAMTQHSTCTPKIRWERG